MSDITVPSWRARQDNPGPNWRMLAVAGGLLGVVALAGAVAWGISRMGPRTIPLIEPDSRPLKIRPESPGGMIVPNQDQLVLEPPSVRRAAERSSGSNARLDLGPEAPALDQLRQQAAPPAAPLPPVQAPAPAMPSLAVPALPPPTLPAPILPAPVAPPPAAAVPAPAPVVVRPGLAPVANGRSLVQLAALTSEESARSEWERLQRRVPELAAFQPQVSRFDRGEGKPPLYRLRAGGLANAAAARSLCEAVRAKAAPCTPIGG
ncbi:MAG: hypothetical protein JWP04_665 [Belnapia sp.]|nr:hypothetical protein [Belnapia sp.]